MNNNDVLEGQKDYLNPSLPEGKRITTGWFETTPLMREYINDILDSGIISYGKYSQMFEREFAKAHHSIYGILSNSGTSSLHVALQTLKEIHMWNDGDEVIVPATTFVATPNIVLNNRMRPVFVDIEMDTYGIDPTLIEAKITDRTRAIIPVHLFGRACNMTDVMRIAKKHGLKVIEDSCETMFVEHDGKRVGSMGDIGCFSMYVAHLITAGVGGISITKNEEYAVHMRSLVNHGLTNENLNLNEFAQPQPMMGRKFIFDKTGHSYRITEFEAALALAQLREPAYRFGIGKSYIARIASINKGLKEDFYLVPQLNYEDSKFPYPDYKVDHAFMMFPIVLTDRDIPKHLCTDYLNERGIETRDMLPILGQPAFHYIPKEDYPISEWVADSGFYVGSHPYITHEEQQFLLQTLQNFASEYTTGRIKND